MIYKNVLVPYDKSEHAARALKTAIQLISDDPEAKLTVLFVADTTDQEDVTLTVAARMAGVGSGNIDIATDENLAYRDQLKLSIGDEIATMLENCPNKVKISIATGKPQHAILNSAYDHENDLIVMGCRGLNAIRGVLGSVSYHVLRHSLCPVFIIK